MFLSTNTHISITCFQGAISTVTNIQQGYTEGHQSKGLPGAVGGVLKHLPGACLQPVIATAGATSNILDGVRNQMQPDKRRETLEKWKPDEFR